MVTTIFPAKMFLALNEFIPELLERPYYQVLSTWIIFLFLVGGGHSGDWKIRTITSTVTRETLSFLELDLKSSTDLESFFQSFTQTCETVKGNPSIALEFK
jgi:chloramphenicol O-acetyltransferase